MKRLLLLFFALLIAVQLMAQHNLDTLRPNRYAFTTAQLIAPAALIAAGTTVLLTTDREVKYYGKKYGYGSYAEDYLVYSPVVATAVFKMAGMKSRTDGVNSLVIGAKISALNFLTVGAIKELTKQPRPDGTNNKGFPSNHTASAFASATAMTIEYGDHYPWVPYAAFGFASGIGALRMVHHKHYLSDVLVGAGIGILTTKLVYWTHQYKWKARKDGDPFSGVIYSK